MNHKDLFKSKLTIRGSQADRRQHIKNKRAMERDNIRNFGRDITITLENSPLLNHETNNEGNLFKQQFKMKYRDIITKKKDKEAELVQWRPPFVSVVPVGKYIEPSTRTALAKRIIKTHENIQKTLTAKKVFPAKTPEELRRSKRNIKRLNLPSETKNNQFRNYVMKMGRENAGFTFVHSTTTKNKNKEKRKSIVVTNNFQVSDEDDLAGISPIEDVSDGVVSPAISVEPILQQNVAIIQNEILPSTSSSSPPVSHLEETNLIPLPNNNYVSPFVTKSRGKKSRGTKKHNSVERLNISKEIESETEEMKINREAASKYEKYLNDEISRLEELNQKWEVYKLENMNLTDCVEMIDGTVGQTKLLISSKFLQFRKVIDNCRFQNGDRPTFPLDLEGFWDVVKLQIKNVDDRFANLEKLKANDWKDDIVTTDVVNKTVVTKKRKTKPKSAISSLKGLIESKRQQQKWTEENNENQAPSSARKTRQSVLHDSAIKHRLRDVNTIEVNRQFDNLQIQSPGVKLTKKRSKSIRFIEPRKSSDSDVILLERSFGEGKENELVEHVTPTNSKRTSKKYRDTPKLSVLNLMKTPQSERRHSMRTPKSKLSFCDEMHNCSIRDSPIRAGKDTPRRTRRITTLINEQLK